ncbi:hypothetical protein O3P69_001161 [Scylla paramamosain]|uniref:Uncharacterized protein n=1 Tax=Scylla paramamosain TaxID=85552 RepID=A0AAW0UT68_SCYPA
MTRRGGQIGIAARVTAESKLTKPNTVRRDEHTDTRTHGRWVVAAKGPSRSFSQSFAVQASISRAARHASAAIRDDAETSGGRREGGKGEGREEGKWGESRHSRPPLTPPHTASQYHLLHLLLLAGDKSRLISLRSTRGKAPITQVLAGRIRRGDR